MRAKANMPKLTLAQVITFVVICFAALLIVNLGEKWISSRNVLAEKRQLSALVEAERTRNAELQVKLEEAKSDAYAEKVLREEFGYVRQNENSVIVQEQATPAPTLETPAPVETQQAPFWRNWLNMFLAP